ncbi:chorismate mutase [Maritimibacter sp. UBA3975]|uniref:chorismate mutase n=1 Tax=Maritimibacter sp. UBA3975 TaxID=1946833 RepID=UPI000C098070|nr:chorismate mutase [Maritimibacter sp. UBA3975]MAM61000.1 chorismate mutase [Maritimibacter sp.]|tara:strand:+ start:745 stop:1059 length:315 start_codon:yes stop_codon:yes gene_type:complete
MTRPDPATLTDLAAIRAGIDAIDDEIMVLLAERMAHVEAVVPIKKREGIAAAAPARAQTVYDKTRARAERLGIDPDMAEAMWRVMVEAIIAREERDLGKTGDDA